MASLKVWRIRAACALSSAILHFPATHWMKSKPREPLGKWLAPVGMQWASVFGWPK